MGGGAARPARHQRDAHARQARAATAATRKTTSCSDRIRCDRHRGESDQEPGQRERGQRRDQDAAAPWRRMTTRASTQTISPDVLASAARMAAAMRVAVLVRRSSSPAPRRAAAARRSAAAGKAAAADDPPPLESAAAEPPLPMFSSDVRAMNQRKPRRDDEQQDHDDNDHDDDEPDQRRIWSVWPGLSSRSDGRCCHSEASVVSTVMMSSTPRAMPPPKSPALKRGVMALVMMTLRQRVGQRAFKPIADLDAHPPLVRRDQQQHAVVLRLLAELPGAEQLRWRRARCPGRRARRRWRRRAGCRTWLRDRRASARSRCASSAGMMLA